MRSRIEIHLWTAAIVALSCAVPAAAAAAAVIPAPVESGAEGFTQAEIAHAIARVKADPNLAPERTIKTLRWKNASEPKRSGIPAWFTWLAGLFRWLDQSARLLVWAAAAVLAGMLVVYLVRLWRAATLSRVDEPFVPPTHVRDLDIRPETLPRDVGAAARALWDRGEHRAALALLYRGLLSRLAHVHRVPIRDSSTEGECLSLAAGRLTPRRSEYAGRLVQVWQRAVYGQEDVRVAIVYALCDEFASLLDRASPSGSAASQGAS
ncbi:MAG TPA: hypothetical protein VK886_01740 [Vicinamibacterales bacterium]|nr:hypothetical protein [Vicinamibacterales bacterium]